MRSRVLASFLWLGWATGSCLGSEADSIRVDYDESAIEVVGTALGFVPARFQFEDYTADVKLQRKTLALVDAEIEFSCRSLTSGKRSRDRKIRKWLEADQYPEGRFLLERLVEEDGERLAIGQLVLHGQAREVRFEYRLQADGDAVELNAVARIDYREWGLPILRVFLFSVRPELEIRLRIVGTV